MRIPRHDLCARAGALLVLCAVFGPADAGVYLDASPTLQLQEEYNSNVTMRQSSPEARYQTVVRPSLAFVAAGKQLRLDGDLSYASRRYSGKGLDSNDWAARATTRYRRKTQQGSLQAGFIQNSTLQSELLTSGLVQTSLKRFERYAAPAWQMNIGSRVTADADYRYSIVDYGQGARGLGLFGYRLQQAGAGIAYQASPVDQISLRSSLLYYRTRDEATKSDDRSLSLGYNHEFSPVTRLGASVGVRQTETSLRQTLLIFTGTAFLPVRQVSHGRKNGIVADLSLAHRGRLITLNVAFERQVQPSGGGNLLQRDQLSLATGRRFSQSLSGNASLMFSRSRDIGALVRTTDYDYVQFSPSLSWRMARDWSLRGYYSYGRQSHANQSQHAQRHLLGVSVSYVPATRAGGLW